VGAIALVSRIVLAVVFVTAAVLKLRDRPRVVRQMTKLVGARLAPASAIVVPLVELGLALWLIVAGDTAIPGLVAIAVLLLFTGVLVRALVRHVPCPCFGGGAVAAPVGPGSIIRNGILLALAVLATG